MFAHWLGQAHLEDLTHYFPDAFSSLYEGVGTHWSDTPGHGQEEQEEQQPGQKTLNHQLYDVVSSDGGVEAVEEHGEEEEEEEGDEDQQYQNRLNKLTAKYGADREAPHDRIDPKHDMMHPLVMLMKLEPHAMDLLVQAHPFVPGTMVREGYKVRRNIRRIRSYTRSKNWSGDTGPVPGSADVRASS